MKTVQVSPTGSKVENHCEGEKHCVKWYLLCLEEEVKARPPPSAPVNDSNLAAATHER